MITGYKVFSPDWTCEGYQHKPGEPWGFQCKVGETYEIDGEPMYGKKGFCFYEKLWDCFTILNFDPENKVAVVTALGDIDSRGNKFYTNKIRIDKELTWSEVSGLVNVGENNEGIGNVGSHNTGCYNVGSHNTGLHNSGWHNMGGYNSGWYNDGWYNFGDNNEGGYNAGSFNVGSYNAGSYNLSDGNAGCFNTKQRTIFMFDKPTGWTITDWRKSNAKIILYFLMRSGDRQKAWDELDENKKREILNLPNFDPEIFYKVTGIEVGGLISIKNGELRGFYKQVASSNPNKETAYKGQNHYTTNLKGDCNVNNG